MFLFSYQASSSAESSASYTVHGSGYQTLSSALSSASYTVHGSGYQTSSSALSSASYTVHGSGYILTFANSEFQLRVDSGGAGSTLSEVNRNLRCMKWNW
jgi:carbon monoxide dehydrogenase subunit G